MNNFKKEYLKKYPKRNCVINKMTQFLGHEPCWKDMDRTKLMKLASFLKKECSPNSARTYLAELKAFLNENGNSVLDTKGMSHAMSVRQVPTISVYLTPEEVRKIEEYVPKTEIERSVKAEFLLESWCGARISDIKALQKENVDMKAKTIKYVSQKTGVLAEVPLHSKFLSYIDDSRLREVGEPEFNRAIKRICKKQGINETVKVFKAGKSLIGEKWEFVSSHTARRSFATNCIMNGVPLTELMQFMGHTSVDMTRRYIMASKPNISENIRKRIFE